LFPIGDDNSSRRIVPLVTYSLIALNVVLFFVELSGGDAFIEKWAFVPSRFLANPFGDFLTLFTSIIITVVVVLVILGAILGLVFSRRNRSERLHDKFGHSDLSMITLCRPWVTRRKHKQS
jgi:hypothetical protein